MVYLQYLDGTTDITRTVHFGKPSEHQKSCYTAVSSIFDYLFLIYIIYYEIWSRLVYFLEYYFFKRGINHGVFMCSHLMDSPFMELKNSLSLQLNLVTQLVVWSMIVTQDPNTSPVSSATITIGALSACPIILLLEHSMFVFQLKAVWYLK